MAAPSRSRPGLVSQVLRSLRQMGRVLWAAVILAVGVPLLCGGTIMASFIFLPLPANVPQPKTTLLTDPSVVYDDQGNVIAQFRASGRDVPVNPADIPEALKNAVIASEDHNFYHEGGVSIKNMLGALYDDVVHGGIVRGGSTITQQYVKNAYTSGKRTLLRKVHEAILATDLSRVMSKQEILYLYLSNCYFGEGSYGAGAAALTYFRTPVKQLDISQAALLAGVLPAPSYYDPLVNLDVAETRREEVLGLMLRYRFIDQAQYTEAMAERLTLANNVKAGVPVTAVYPPQEEQQSRYPYFIDYLRRYLVARLGPDELYGGGLRIQSTLDPADEAQAEASVGRGLGTTALPIDMALVSLEPASGYVKALVGGRDYAESQVNLALGGCPAEPSNPNWQIVVTASCWDGQTITGGGTGMPPGSSFKVFTLLAALSQGVSLDRTYFGPPSISIGGTTFHNAESEGGGYYNLRSATWLSINTVYVQLANDIGVKNIATMAKQMGVTSAWYSPQVHGLSYTLGDIDVSPLDMASAYGVLANQGVRVEPSPVVKVVDATGKTLIDDTNPSGNRVISANLASTVTQVLEGVIAHGTAYPNAVIGRPEAGKTGTTDQCTNAWFTGYTPQLATSVWMGHLNSTQTPLHYVEGVPCVYGGTIPARTWGDYMKNALQGVPVADFATPPPITPAPDLLNRLQRGGIDPGYRQYPYDIGSGGSYVEPAPQPNAVAPTTTTTTEPASTTTTTQAPPPTIVPGPAAPP